MPWVTRKRWTGFGSVWLRPACYRNDQGCFVDKVTAVIAEQRVAETSSVVRSAVGESPPKTVRSHGWRSPSAPWMGRRSVFWEGFPPPRSLQSQKNEQMLESFVNSRHFMGL